MKTNPSFLAVVSMFPWALQLRALSYQLLPPTCLHSLRSKDKHGNNAISTPWKPVSRFRLYCFQTHSGSREHTLFNIFLNVGFRTLVTNYYHERVRFRFGSSKAKRGINAIGMLWIPWKGPISIFPLSFPNRFWVTNACIVQYCAEPLIFMLWETNLYRERFCTRIKRSRNKRGNNALAIHWNHGRDRSANFFGYCFQAHSGSRKQTLFKIFLNLGVSCVG